MYDDRQYDEYEKLEPMRVPPGFFKNFHNRIVWMLRTNPPFIWTD